MGLIRTTVVVGAVVALMPTDRAQQLRIADQAGAAAKWTLTFCDRNAVACTQASDAWGVFVKKAQFAGQLAVELVNDARAPQPGPQPSAPQPAALQEERVVVQPPRRSTLTPDDLKPTWRGRNGA